MVNMGRRFPKEELRIVAVYLESRLEKVMAGEGQFGKFLFNLRLVCSNVDLPYADNSISEMLPSLQKHFQGKNLEN
jgi:hypothetical protein